MKNQPYQYNLGLRFYAVAEQNSSRVALRYPDGKEITYAGVNDLSNRIASYLLQNGLVKGDVVAIFNDKSEFGYGLMLACLKVGAIYTNLDNSSPWERIKKILGTCTPKILFYGKGSAVIIKEMNSAFPSLALHDFNGTQFQVALKTLKGSDRDHAKHVHGSDPAYIMFTSGSTGFPKGAVMSHSNVLNFVAWAQQTFEVTPDDIFTNANPIYFDNSVFDFYASLFSGSTLVPLDNNIVKNARTLVQAINDTSCSIWFSVPSLLVYLLTTKALNASDFPSVKRIVFGGEGFPKNKLKQLHDLFGKRMMLYNVYGPTECTCICSSYLISEGDFSNMTELAPLGYIAPNFGYEIIPAEQNNPEYGELGLTGPCVGLGYYNDQERTIKAFVQNSGKLFHQRMYKTGDIVERGKNGYLYFRGRIDNQIKHMGYRIELEEVEAAFSSLGYVNEVGVVYEKITPELGQIKAFISLSNNTIDTKEILEHIKAILPAYMIPKIFVLDALPKNSNGKIDRKQLKTIPVS